MKKVYFFLVAVMLVSLVGGAYLSRHLVNLYAQEEARLHDIMQSLSHEEIDRILKEYKNSSRAKQTKALLDQYRAEDRASGYIPKTRSIPLHLLQPQERLAKMPIWEKYLIEDYFKEHDSTCKVIHENIVTFDAIESWTKNIFPCSVFAFPIVLLLHFLLFTYQKFKHGNTTKQQRLGLVILTSSLPVFLLSVLVFDTSYFRPINDLQWGYTYAWVFLTAIILFFLGVGFILPVFQTIFELGKKIHAWVNKGD